MLAFLKTVALVIIKMLVLVFIAMAVTRVLHY